MLMSVSLGYNCSDVAITTVHVVQSCHLDVGFTLSVHDVINKYFTQYIPGVITAGKALRNASSTPPPTPPPPAPPSPPAPPVDLSGNWTTTAHQNHVYVVKMDSAGALTMTTSDENGSVPSPADSPFTFTLL